MINENENVDLIDAPRPIHPSPSEIALGVAARCWCDKETGAIVMDSVLATAFAKRIDLYADAIETAWGIIANSSNWDDGKGTPGWKEAAERFREHCLPLMYGKQGDRHL